jgi:hypothetical protein
MFLSARNIIGFLCSVEKELGLFAIYGFTFDPIHVDTDVNRNCIYSHKYTLLAQGIVTSNRCYCIAEHRLNNILIYFDNFMKL